MTSADWRWQTPSMTDVPTPDDREAVAPAIQPPTYAVAPQHPQTTTVLVLGILSLVVCQVIGPFAWSMGNRVIREIDASGGRLGGRETVNIGRILGIVATALLALALVMMLVWFLFFGVMVVGGAVSS